MPPVARVLARHLGCVLLGAGVALGALTVHRLAPPAGLLLALACSFGVPGRLLVGSQRRTAASYVVGWLAMFGLVVTGRPEGDFLLAGDMTGLTLVAAAIVMAAFGVVALAGKRHRAT